MKVLIWLGCIFLYSSAQTMMMNSGQFGGLTAIVLATILVFIPAPLLCKQYTKWREKRDEEEAEEARLHQRTSEETEVSHPREETTEEISLLQEPQPEAVPVIVEETKSDDEDHSEEIQDTDPPSNLVVLDLVLPEEEGEAETKNGCNKNGKWFIPICILSCVFAVSLCVLGCIAIQQSAEINELKTTVSSLQDANSTLELQRSTAVSRANRLEATNRSLRTQNSQLSDEHDFWENHAVILDRSYEIFHWYGCSKISNPDYSFICNIEVARELGYSACSDCKPLTAKERLAQMISE